MGIKPKKFGDLNTQSNMTNSASNILSKNKEKFIRKRVIVDKELKKEFLKIGRKIFEQLGSLMNPILSDPFFKFIENEFKEVNYIRDSFKAWCALHSLFFDEKSEIVSFELVKTNEEIIESVEQICLRFLLENSEIYIPFNLKFSFLFLFQQIQKKEVKKKENYFSVVKSITNYIESQIKDHLNIFICALDNFTYFNSPLSFLPTNESNGIPQLLCELFNFLRGFCFF